MDKKILIIEDSKTINNIIKTELSKLTYDVDQAFTFAQAHDLLISTKYNIIILDLHLPDGEGYELIEDIKSLTTTKVIVLTSETDKHLRDKLFHYGILDYIVKDKNILFSINEIHKNLQNIYRKHQDRILVIDDSKFICKQIKLILEPRDYEVFTANNGADGLAMLDELHFDLLVLDIMLPDIDGLEVLKKIRANPQLINLPIVVLSGIAKPSTIRAVLKGGGNDFLHKPFIIEEFILKVDLWLNSSKKDIVIKEQSKQLETISEDLNNKIQTEVEKTSQQQILFMHQTRLAQIGEMLSMIAHQWRQPLSAISSTSSALNLQAQFDEIDKTKVLELTNKISQYAQHLSSTIDDFRDFFQPSKEKAYTTFSSIINSVLNIAEVSLENKNIQIIKELNSDVELLTYPNKLKQVVLNLIKNSEDAFLENKIQDAYIKIITYNKTLMIEDNAGGIDPNIIANIFDPYFSTKANKDGTGLGLYMSKTIIEKHCDGNINVTNTKDGVRFTIEL